MTATTVEMKKDNANKFKDHCNQTTEYQFAQHNPHAYVITDEWINEQFRCVYYDLRECALICVRKQNDERNEKPSILDFAYIWAACMAQLLLQK